MKWEGSNSIKENNMFTKEKKKEYLQNPNKCPYCGSNDISSGHLEADYNMAWSTVICDSCGKEWRDLYTLTDIEEKE